MDLTNNFIDPSLFSGLNPTPDQYCSTCLEELCICEQQRANTTFPQIPPLAERNQSLSGLDRPEFHDVSPQNVGSVPVGLPQDPTASPGGMHISFAAIGYNFPEEDSLDITNETFINNNNFTSIYPNERPFGERLLSVVDGTVRQLNISGVPCITEEPCPFPCKDFLGRGRSNIQLYPHNISQSQISDFQSRVDNEGCQIQVECDESEASLLAALQKGLAYFCGRIGKSIPTLNQLQRFGTASYGLQMSRRDIILAILHSYGKDIRQNYQLGIISPRNTQGTYTIEVNPLLFTEIQQPTAEALSSFSRTQESNVVWFYHEVTGSDGDLRESWSAIVPNDIIPSQPTYASVLKNQPPQRPSLQLTPAPSETDPRYLSPETPTHHYHHPHNYHSPRTTQSSRRRYSYARSNHSSPASYQTKGHRSSRSSRPSSECGSVYSCDKCQQSYDTQSDLNHHQRKYFPKNHPCQICQRAFHYPKDLKRHMTTHNGGPKSPCQFCPKVYGRPDNLRRHIRNEHAEKSSSGSNAAEQ